MKIDAHVLCIQYMTSDFKNVTNLVLTCIVHAQHQILYMYCKSAAQMQNLFCCLHVLIDMYEYGTKYSPWCHQQINSWVCGTKNFFPERKLHFWVWDQGFRSCWSFLTINPTFWCWAFDRHDYQESQSVMTVLWKRERCKAVQLLRSFIWIKSKRLLW